MSAKRESNFGFWRKIFLLLLSFVMALALLRAVFILAIESASANLTQDQSGEFLSSHADIDQDLLDKMAQEGSADFVVILAEKPDLSKATDIQDWSERGWYVYNTLLEVASRTQAPIISYALEHNLQYRSFFSNNLLYFAKGNIDNVNALAQLSGVLHIRLPQKAQIEPEFLAGPAVPESFGWNLDTLDPNSGLFGMQATQVWQQYGITGEGIVVANIDTGAFYQHVALDRQYRGNLTGDIGGPYNHDYSWYQPNYMPCGNGTYPCDADFYGHGTGTIGLMTGETPDLSKQIGVAPDAKWISCMGCDDPPYCTEEALLGCADWMLAPCAIGDNPGDPSCDPDKRPQIVNNSWGGGGCDAWYQSSVQAWIASGIFPAFAAGNAGGCGTLASPGDLPESFGIAAHFTDGVNAYAGGPSCFFPTPTCDPAAHDIDPHVNAPTAGETAANEQATYTALGGTSGATPHVAGTVALLWSANPGLIGQIDATYTILEQSANRDLPATTCGMPACADANGYPNYDLGWGYLDALAAVQMAGAGALGTLQGTVVESVSLNAPGDPLAGVSITAWQPDGIYPLSGQTDLNGFYTLTLPSGTYTVTADGPQHGPASVNGVNVISHTITTQDFQLLPKGLLVGYVTDAETGDPLAASVSTAEAGPVETDPLTGFYSIYLGAGNQTVLVEANNFANQTIVLDIVSGQQIQQDFALVGALDLAPDPIEANVELFGSLDLTTVITNNTMADYDYQISHEAARAGDEAPVLLVNDETLTENPDAFAIAFSNLGYDYVLIDGAAFYNTAISELLTYAAVVYTGVPAAGAEQDHIIAYLDAGGRFLLADGSFTLYYGDSRLHEVYLQALDDGLEEWAGPQTGLDIMAGLTPDISSAIVVYDSYIGSEGVGIFQAPGSHFTGIRTERAGYRAIFLSFDLNRIGARDPGDATETDVVYRAMLWLLGYPVEDHWYSTDPVSGIIPASGSGSFVNQFSATPAGGIDQPGEFYAELHIAPSAMGQIYPRLDVPLHMTVLPAATMGKVNGVITSDRPGGPMATQLLFESAGGDSWTTSSDWWTGDYGYWLEAGTYTLTIAEAGYYSQTAQVTLTAGMTTTQDFYLTLAAPEISIIPSALDESLLYGSTTTRTLQVLNSGPENLNFEVQERDRGLTPILQNPSALGANPQDLDGAHILFDQYHGGDPSLYNELFTDLQSLGVTIDVWSTGPITSTVLEGYDVLFIGDFLDIAYGYDELDAIDSFVRQGGGLFVTYECCDDTTAPVVTQMFDIVYIGRGGTAGVTHYVYPHPTTQGVGAVWLPSPQFIMTATITGTAQIVLYDLGGDPAAAVNEVGNGKVFVMPDQEFWDGVYNDVDNAHFALNVFNWLYGDVGWMSTDVVTATVLPGEALTMTITFDGGSVNEPAIYYGDLTLPNNDPLTPTPSLPITMTVEPTADLGRLQGFVTSDRPGGSLPASLMIENSEGITLTVYSLPSSGEYHRWLPADTYTITASSAGYITQTTSIQVIPAVNVQLDFELALDAPGIATIPTGVEETLTWGLTSTQLITASNIGLQDLDFILLEEDLGIESVTQAPQAFTFDFENDAFASFYLDAPTDWTIIQTWSYQHFEGGDFRLNDFSQLYVIWGNYLATLDTQTGEWDLIADIPITYPHTLSGMTISADGTLYVISYVYDLFNPTESYLWTLDPATADANLIGHISNAQFIGDIAINLAGEMYGVDLDQDVLMQIDPVTAAGTVVGSLGFDLWTGTLDFDDDSGVLYMGTWDYLTDQGYLWTMNTSTGMPTVVGDFPSGRGVAFLAIAADGKVGIPWLNETPLNGTIIPGGTEPINLTFDAGDVSGPGSYRGNLHVITNDPIIPDLSLPITMTVVAGGDIGQIEGVVAGTGHCDQDFYPLTAQVVLESSSGLTWTVDTDPQSGFYSQWVYSGTYTVTAQSTEHVTATAIAQVEAEQTTQQDFNLRLYEACLAFSPETYTMTLSVGSLLTQSLTITNSGAQDLIWALKETTDTLAIPPIPSFTGEIPYSPAPLSIEPLSISSNPSANQTTYPMISPAPLLYGEPAFALDTGPFNLVHIPDISDPGNWEVLSNVGTFYSGGDFWHGDYSKLYALDFYTNEFVTLDLSNGERTVIGVANTLPGHHWTGLTAATDGTFYGVSTECNVASALYTINRLDGEAVLLGTTTSAPCLIDVAINAQGQMYGVDISTDALYKINPASGAATAIGLLGFNANHAQSIDFEEESGILYWAAADEYNGSLRRIDPTTGASLHLGYFPNYTGVDCLAFATGGGDPFWGDVPWVREVPTSGVTLADDVFTLDVAFDTTDLTAGECYTAGLGILHDDPYVEQPAFLPLNLCATTPWPVYYLYKTVDGGTMMPGDPVTYTVVFGNDGSLETGITISDVLPVEVEYGWSEPDGMIYDAASHTLVWKNLVLDSGARITATIGTMMDPDVEMGTWFTNTVYLLWRDDTLSDWSSLQAGGQVQEPVNIYLPLITKQDVGKQGSSQLQGFISTRPVSFGIFANTGILPILTLIDPQQDFPLVCVVPIGWGTEAASSPAFTKYLSSISRAPP